uniref:Uncharacterized protein n=1 Tax=viral metagenome TaxID=1070528 RepID=A0A6C0IJU3_9ZZZZ
MSGPWSGYNTEPVNFNYQVEKYANPYGKVAGVGCDGTKYGPDAVNSVYSSPFVGGNGYSFTDTPIAPVAGPGAPYSEIREYNDRGNYRNLFPPLFQSALTGGKRRGRRSMRKYGSMRKIKTQYGCSSRKIRGGRKHKRKTMKHRMSKRTTKKRGHGKRRTMRRTMHKSMRGGMSSASDYTEGRDASQDQPYGNKAYSFGQGLDSMLSANESALASPTPLLPYNTCGKYMRT